MGEIKKLPKIFALFMGVQITTKQEERSRISPNTDVSDYFSLRRPDSSLVRVKLTRVFITFLIDIF